MSTHRPPPTWQTDELAEAWPDSDSSHSLSQSRETSSPNQTGSNSISSLPARKQHDQQQQIKSKLSSSSNVKPEEVEAMYGSIKYLGSSTGPGPGPRDSVDGVRTNKSTKSGAGPGPSGLIGMTPRNGKDSGKGLNGIGMGGMRIVSGDVSFEGEHHRSVQRNSSGNGGGGGDIPSPPSSGSESHKQFPHSRSHRPNPNNPSPSSSSSSSSSSSPAAGTFLVRPTSTDSTDSTNAPPAFLAKVRAAAGGGGNADGGGHGGGGAGAGGKGPGGGMRGLGIFEPLAIERMFDPPTPPQARVHVQDQDQDRAMNGNMNEEIGFREEQVEEENGLPGLSGEPNTTTDINRPIHTQETRFPSNATATSSGLGGTTTASTTSSATARPYGTLSRSAGMGGKRSYPVMTSADQPNREGGGMVYSPENISAGTFTSTSPPNPNIISNTNGNGNNTIPLRRTSHGFVPRRPSRLSESMTPPSPGRSSISGGPRSGRSSPVGNESGSQREDSMEDEERSDVRVAGGADDASGGGGSRMDGGRRMRYFSGQRDSMDDVGFTFSPSPPPANFNRRPSVPDAGSPFQPTPTNVASSGSANNETQNRPRALKLFQLKYDTYTRDHVNELVDKLSNAGTPVKRLADRSAARRRRSREGGAVHGSGGMMGSGMRHRVRSGSGGRAGDMRTWLRTNEEGSPYSSAGSGSGSGSSPRSGSPPEESGFEGGESSEDGSLREREPKRIRLSEPLEDVSDEQEHSSWGSPQRDPNQSDMSAFNPSLPQRHIIPANIASTAVSMAAAASAFKLGHGQKGDRRSWGEKGESLLQKIKQRGLGGSPSVSSVTESSVGDESGSRSLDTMQSAPRQEASRSLSPASQFDLPPTPPLRSSRMITAPTLPQRAPAMLSVPAQANANAAPRVSLRQPSGTVNSAHSGGSAQTSGGGTSSGSGTITSHYMANGRDIMDRIKQRKVSESSGTATGGEAGEPAINVVLADRQGKGRERSDAGLPPPPVHVMVTEASMRPSSVASSRITVSRNVDNLAPAAVEDVNQYISSASTATNTVGTAISTSFVKHRGPPSPPPRGGAKRITRLAPHQVPRLGAPQGKMVYDARAMSWVKVSGAHARLQQASTNEGSSSSGSEDVFAGLESLREDTPGPSTRSAEEAVLEEELFDEEQVEAPLSDQSVVHTEEGDSMTSKSTDSMAVLPAESESPSLMTADPSVAQQDEMPARAPTAQRLRVKELARPLFKTVHSAPTPLENPGTPRSALKAAGAPGSAIKKTVNIGSVIPARAEQQSPDSTLRRSVSFSDGRNDGKLRNGSREEGKSRKRASTPARSVVDKDVFGDDGERYGIIDRSVAASARTKRISKMLDGMDEDTVTPSRPSSGRHVRRMSDTYDLTEENLTADTTIEGLSGFYARLRPSGSTGRNLADATFLTECSFGVAHDKLVEIITEVQPFEPHWEELTKIDLSKRGATSVARLKEFLPKLDEANLNDNEISYLSGVPSTVRTLHVAGNRLTSVTAINHLLNLQYLDISRNDVDSVNPLSCLKHLRELKMDHNRVHDLSDIMSIDSLVKLSATNNALDGLDTTRAKWSRLESLDVSRNRISDVRGIETLTSMHTLNLDNNRLDDFSIRKEMPTLRILRVSHNRIPRIDISDFPRLRTLYADGNRLEGLHRSKAGRLSKIEHLSLRNQSGQRLHLTYADLRDVKRLYISGNPLASDFFPDRPLYSLIYLEAAACRLSAWPTDFSALIPNLRALNVNYNFIDELDGLRGLQSLRKLSVVGAQLGQKGREGVMRAIKALQAVEEIDLRMNPCTLGFYLPLVLPGGTEASALNPSDVAPNTPEALWVQMDNTFRRSMPDVWYAKRLLYRGLLMEACQDLVRVDGIQITAAERTKARSIAEMAM